jgi:hypothetical protein
MKYIPENFLIQSVAVSDCFSEYGGFINIESDSTDTARMLSNKENSIRDSNFTFNNASFGGVIFTKASNFIISGCIFSENTASINGGAIVLMGNNPSNVLTIENSFFHNNTATYYSGNYYSLNPKGFNLVNNIEGTSSQQYITRYPTKIEICIYYINTTLSSINLLSYEDFIKKEENVRVNSII